MATLSMKCPECGESINLRIWPHVHAKLSGHPDSWHPDEGGDYEPEDCPHCHKNLEADKVWEAWAKCGEWA